MLMGPLAGSKRMDGLPGPMRIDYGRIHKPVIPFASSDPSGSSTRRPAEAGTDSQDLMDQAKDA